VRLGSSRYAIAARLKHELATPKRNVLRHSQRTNSGFTHNPG
jgi:hypothetical protein